MMNQALDSNLIDFANYPTVKCPVLAKPTVEQAVQQLAPKRQEEENSLQLSMQEPCYPVFSLVPCVVFLSVFMPLFLFVAIHANNIIYVFAMLMGKITAMH
jgi:hypothetical protein